MADYSRKCDNWLKDFGKWTLPRSEAPETFIFWTGLYNLAAALRRHVKIPKRLLGSWECSPNLYVLFIAPAGKARKSTTVNYTEDLLEEIPDITRSPELITKERLMSRLVKSPDASMYVTAPEFGEFMVKSGPEMYGFLTNAYDGRKKLDADTHVRQLEFVERPCVNLLGATTPEWVAENMPESVIGGGFASRVIFLYEERKRVSEIFYDHLDQEELERLRSNLVADLAHIATNLNGEFDFAPDAKDFTRKWYKGLGEETNYKLSGYFERKPAHIFKVAMLLHLARKDTLILELEDIVEAMTLLEQVERKLPDVFVAVGKNPYVIDAKRIATFIKEKGRVSEQELKRQFFHVAQPETLSALIRGMVEMGRVRELFRPNPNDPAKPLKYYEAISPNGASTPHGTQQPVRGSEAGWLRLEPSDMPSTDPEQSKSRERKADQY